MPERDFDILTIADMCVDLIMDLGEAMPGIEIRTLKPEEQLAARGW